MIEAIKRPRVGLFDRLFPGQPASEDGAIGEVREDAIVSAAPPVDDAESHVISRHVLHNHHFDLISIPKEQHCHALVVQEEAESVPIGPRTTDLFLSIIADAQIPLEELGGRIVTPPGPFSSARTLVHRR